MALYLVAAVEIVYFSNLNIILGSRYSLIMINLVDAKTTHYHTSI